MLAPRTPACGRVWQLDTEYTALARQVVAKLARKRPSPLLSGRRATWAAGVVYALGQVNFLFDPSREPYRTADELRDAFGVAKTTMGSKAGPAGRPFLLAGPARPGAPADGLVGAEHREAPRYRSGYVRRLAELPGDWPPPEELGLR